MLTSLRRSPKAVSGLVVLGVFVVLAVIGPWIAPDNPSRTTVNILQAPSLHHLLGTTQTGQDVLSQVLVGTRTTMLVGFVAAGVATVLAVLVGVTAGYVRGTGDEVLSMVSNVFLAIPALPLLIVLSAYLKNSGWLAISIIISITAWAFGARVLRAQSLSLRDRDFIRACRAGGERHWRIVVFEMMPNLSAVIISTFLFTFLGSMLAFASLAFLGLTSTTQWSWGTILFWAQSAEAFQVGAWWWFIPPGVCLALVGMSLTLINLGADEIIDPRLVAVRSARRSARERADLVGNSAS